MGQELYEKSDRVKEFYKLASELLGDDLAAISFNGPAERLKQTKFTQPAVLIHSLALLEILGNDLPAPNFTAGHSLGEYAALACSRAITIEEAITAVCHRSMLMEEACLKNPGTMAAILAIPLNKLEEVCKQASALGVVTAANINSSIQVAISGGQSAVEEACRLAGEAGAKKAIMLEVGGAFHSSLMSTASAGMSQCLDKINIKEANPPVVANVSARPVTDADEIRQLLIKQITSPVRWWETMKFLLGDGVETVIEIGPGRVLSGLAKRDMPGVTILHIDRLADAEVVLGQVI
jgi:[acyl-carrier-protein] S-malonyltransferase